MWPPCITPVLAAKKHHTSHTAPHWLIGVTVSCIFLQTWVFAVAAYYAVCLERACRCELWDCVLALIWHQVSILAGPVERVLCLQGIQRVSLGM